MKAVINDEYTITLCDSARLTKLTKNLTFIRVKKGTFADIELVRAASLGHFDLDDQGDEWRLTIETETIKWAE